MFRRVSFLACLLAFPRPCSPQSGRAVRVQPVFGRALAALAQPFGINNPGVRSLKASLSEGLFAASPGGAFLSRQQFGTVAQVATFSAPVAEESRPEHTALRAARESGASLAQRFTDEVAPAVESALQAGASVEGAYGAGRALDNFLLRSRSGGGQELALAPDLRLDPGMSAPVRRDLERLQTVLHRVDLRKNDFYRGLPPELRARQRAYFSWLKRQVDREGNLPFFELTEHLAIYGEYLGWSDLALVHNGKNRRRAERLATMVHESYHRYAAWIGLPHVKDGHEVQERDAAIAELLLWGPMRVLPDLATANFLRLLRQGRVDAIQDYVDRVYGKAMRPDPALQKLLHIQLEVRVEQLRRLFDRTRSQLVARRLNAIRRHLIHGTIWSF